MSGKTLIYGTGGVSLGSFNYQAVNPTSGTTIGGTATHDGWNIGGGFEHMLGSRWSTGLEFRHVQFSSVDHGVTNSAVPGSAAIRTVEPTDNIVNLRLNYHFNGD